MATTPQTPSLLDHLMDAGYEPEETDPEQGDWYILTASGVGSVRVVITDTEADVHAFDKYMGCRWSSRMSGAPASVIIATIEAAEWELAALRGGPVTPAQAATAR
jgi:hypothetical protein